MPYLVKVLCRVSLLCSALCLFATTAFADEPNHPSHSLLALPAEKVSLTLEETAFLQSHPTIHLGTSSDWEPYVVMSPTGVLEGFEIDILHHLNTVTGANIEMVVGHWAEIVRQAKARDLDGLAVSAASKERAESFLFSDSYVSVYPAFVMAANDSRKVDDIADLAGETVAILASNKFYETMLAAYPQITVVGKPTETEAISLVLEGKAAAALVATTSFDKHYKDFSRLIRIGYIATDKPLQVLYSIRKDWPELVSIINKGLAALPVKSFNEIYARWFGQEPPEINNQQGDLRFSAAEQSWLAQRHVVRAYVGNYMPYYSYSEDGVRGMSVDYLNMVAERAGFKVDYVRGNSWIQATNDIREHRIDLLPAAYITPERKQFLVFTTEYLTSPSVIFTRKDSPFVGSITDLLDKKIVVERDYATTQWLTERFPTMKQLVSESTDEAIQALAAGDGDAYIGNLTVTTYIARKKGLSNLKVAAPSPFVSDDQAMAVRNDWPELVSVIDKTLATFTPAEHAALRDRWLEPIRYEYGISSSDVVELIVEVSIVLLIVIVVILIWNKKLAREIAARALAEEHIIQSEEKYRTLFEHSADAILIIKDGRFIDCNDATVKMLGYASKKEFLNTTPEELSPAEQPDGQGSETKAAEMIATAIALGSHRFEWDHLRANGEVFPVEVLLTAVSAGEELILHVVWRDISVRKAAERIQGELTEDLERKNQELERFTYTVSHDLKSPLVTIKGFAGILRQSLGERLDEDLSASLDFIDSAANKMYTLLDELLELSRIGRVVNASEPVCLAAVTREALELLSGLLAGKQVVIEVTEDLPTVTGDPTRLREVMQNLIENAIKYMGPQPEPRIEVGVAAPGGARACYVRDNGMGIAAQYHEKVFGLFERLSPDGDGTGVGLAQVRRIVELHGGRIWIESEGEGTIFWFTLPWQEQDS